MNSFWVMPQPLEDNIYVRRGENKYSPFSPDALKNVVKAPCLVIDRERNNYLFVVRLAHPHKPSKDKYANYPDELLLLTRVGYTPLWWPMSLCIVVDPPTEGSSLS